MIFKILNKYVTYIQDEVVPKNLRNKNHIKQTLKIGEDTEQHDSFLSKVVDSTLKELKKVYEAAIKPLEMTFKYRDLSNRHFGGNVIINITIYK